MTATDPMATPCPRCGYLDIPTYEDEAPICPGCGGVLDQSAPAVPTWLDQWPPAKRSGLAQLFYAAVRSGAMDPAAIVEEVRLTLVRRLQWTVDTVRRQWFSQILNTMADDPAHVQRYAAAVLAREQLPREAKSALKRTQAHTFMQEAMQGKPVTEAQIWRLRREGYTGTIPDDRREASALIDQLLREKAGRP
jgi:hypothetical protein